MSLPFGKFKGKTVEEVAATDISYLSWVLNASASWDRPLAAPLKAAIQAAISKNATAPGSVSAANSGSSSSSSTAATPGTVSLLLGTIAPRPTTITSHTSVTSSSEPNVNFGKYRGSPLSVLISDRKYCEWLLQQDFFKRNSLYSKVAAAIGVPIEKEVVTTIYSSGSSGIHVAGDGGTCTFGRYKNEPLSKMLLDHEYCAWVVKAAESWETKPRHYDKIVEAASKATGKKSYSRQEDDHWEPPDEDYEIDDTPLEDPDDECEVDDRPLEDPDD